MSDTPVTDSRIAAIEHLSNRWEDLQRHAREQERVLRSLMPFVLEDYWPNCATPAYKAAVEAAIEVTGCKPLNPDRE